VYTFDLESICIIINLKVRKFKVGKVYYGFVRLNADVAKDVISTKHIF